MKKKNRDYLTISMAMLTVLLCGYGLGHLVGEKKGLKNHATSDPAFELSDNWATQTLSQMERTLDLTPEQLKFAEKEIRPFSITLEKDLRQLRMERTRNLLEFYETLKPRLDARQKIELEKLENSLRETRSL